MLKRGDGGEFNAENEGGERENRGNRRRCERRGAEPGKSAAGRASRGKTPLGRASRRKIPFFRRIVKIGGALEKIAEILPGSQDGKDAGKIRGRRRAERAGRFKRGKERGEERKRDGV